MAGSSRERTASVSSASTEADNFNEKSEKRTLMASNDDEYKLRTPEELDDLSNDVERADLLAPPPVEEKPKAPDGGVRSAAVWMVVNTLATIGIVSSSWVHISAALAKQTYIVV
jgi:solute carrier family 35 protein E3